MQYIYVSEISYTLSWALLFFQMRVRTASEERDLVSALTQRKTVPGIPPTVRWEFTYYTSDLIAHWQSDSHSKVDFAAVSRHMAETGQNIVALLQEIWLFFKPMAVLLNNWEEKHNKISGVIIYASIHSCHKQTSWNLSEQMQENT